MAEPTIIHKLHAELLTATDYGESTQRVESDPALGTPEDAIQPPEALERLKAWTQINGTRRACIEAVVTNTVGLGYAIALAPGHERDNAGADADEGHRELVATLERLAARDVRMHRPTFTALLKAARWDYEEVGNAYIEVSRDRQTGLINGLYYAPGHRMRRRKDRKGWVLVSADGTLDKGTPFVNFGEKVVYNRAGKPLPRLAPGARSWSVNEVIAFQRWTSESRDYGLPADSSLAVEYLGDQLAAAANVGFFDSSGTPPTILFVQGEERKDGTTIHVSVPPDTAARVQATMKSGGERHARVAIVPIPTGVKVQREELGKVSDRDLGFVDFRDDMRQRTLSAFRLGPVFIALDSAGGRYTAEVQRALAKEQVFDPEQTQWEDRLHATLLAELGASERRIVFNDLAVEDGAAKREGAVRMAEAGAITRREFRAAFNRPPLPEAPKDATEPEPGQVPFGWNDEIIDLGEPRGAENRAPESDQRGLQPGVGARMPRSGPNEQARGPRGARPRTEQVEQAVAGLTGAAGGRVRGGARRAAARARSLVEEG